MSRFSLDRKISGEVIRLAAPVVLAMLTQTAINLADTIMVGYLPKHMSIAGQSAIGYSLIVVWSMGGFLSALGIGTQALVARRVGEGKKEAAGAVLLNAIVVSIISSIAVSIWAWDLLDDLFRFLSPSEEVVRVGTSYCQWRVIGLVSMVATASYKGFFDGLGATRVHMVAAIIMNILNLVLNYVLIFGVGPFPALYVDGAAIASMIASFVGLFLMFGWTLIPRYLKPYRHLRLRAISWRVTWSVLKLSVPSGMATMVMMTGFALFFKIVGMLDEQAVADHLKSLVGEGSTLQGFIANPPDLYTSAFVARPPIYTAAAKVVTDIMSVVFMSCIALGTGTATLVGQSLGRKNAVLATKYGIESIKIGVYATGIVGLVLIFAPETIILAFSKDIEVIMAARATVQVMGVGNILVAAGLVASYALFGAGNTRYVMTVQAILHFTCLVPIAWFLAIFLELGMMGAFGALVIYAGLLAFFMVRKFTDGSIQNIEI